MLPSALTFESHHFGIETMVSQMGSQKPKTLNRTTLELKHGYKASAFCASGNFESHHFGIETRPSESNRADKTYFESHHFGIETNDGKS